MRKLIIIFCLLLTVLTVQGASLKGIRIESAGISFVVYIDGQQVCSPTSSCFVANLSRGDYQVEVYSASIGRRGEYERRGKLLYNERIRYTGIDIKDIFIERGSDRPTRPRPGNDYDDASSSVMNRDSFERFFRSLKEKTFDSEKIEFLDMALLTSYFTSAQCQRLVDLYTFDSEKLKIMQKMYPRIADKQNFYLVIDKLTFQSDRKKMNDFVTGYHSGHN